MKNIYKNPMLYYIAVPVLIALWPLLIWGFYLPGARTNWKNEKDQFVKAEGIIKQILPLDPAKLEFAGSAGAAVEFDYANAVEKIANLCGISTSSYKLSSGIPITSGGQKSQSARVSLQQVDIAQFARFFSTLQFRWGSLQCTNLKLTKKKGLANSWDVDMDFRYYY